ncbi:hypothetical protein BDV95DRAFT_646491, partial [Massariosphaeria phaeospora]
AYLPLQCAVLRLAPPPSLPLEESHSFRPAASELHNGDATAAPLPISDPLGSHAASRSLEAGDVSRGIGHSGRKARRLREKSMTADMTASGSAPVGRVPVCRAGAGACSVRVLCAVLTASDRCRLRPRATRHAHCHDDGQLCFTGAVREGLAAAVVGGVIGRRLACRGWLRLPRLTLGVER